MSKRSRREIRELAKQVKSLRKRLDAQEKAERLTSAERRARYESIITDVEGYLGNELVGFDVVKAAEEALRGESA